MLSYALTHLDVLPTIDELQTIIRCNGLLLLGLQSSCACVGRTSFCCWSRKVQVYVTLQPSINALSVLAMAVIVNHILHAKCA
jgi:hypothetical protein